MYSQKSTSDPECFCRRCDAGYQEHCVEEAESDQELVERASEVRSAENEHCHSVAKDAEDDEHRRHLISK